MFDEPDKAYESYDSNNFSDFNTRKFDPGNAGDAASQFKV